MLPPPSLGVSSLDLGRRHPPAALFLRKLFSGGAVRPQLFDWDQGQAVGEDFELAGKSHERRNALVAALVHVQRAVDLELYRMQPGRRISVVLGDEAPRIGLVAADRVTEAAQRRLDRLGDGCDATRAVAVAEYH